MQNFANRLALSMVDITERQDFHAGASPTTVRSSKRRPRVCERPVPMSEIWNLVNRTKLEDEELDVETELHSAWLILPLPFFPSSVRCGVEIGLAFQSTAKHRICRISHIIMICQRELRLQEKRTNSLTTTDQLLVTDVTNIRGIIQGGLMQGMVID
jgi:hypothetical protein